MATATASPVIVNASIEALEGGSRVGKGALHVGVVDRNDGAPRRYQIFANITATYALEVGSKETSGVAVPLHEIPLMRLKYRDGGQVHVRAHWVPGVNRAQGMTELALRQERERLEKSYGDVFGEVYGGQKGTPCTLWDAMHTLAEAWNAMQERVARAERRMRDEDLEEVIQTIAVDRIADTIDMIPYPDAAAEAPATPGVALDGALLAFLAANDVPDDRAQAFAQAVANANGCTISDADWSAVPGVGAHQQKRMSLLKLLGDYQARVKG